MTVVHLMFVNHFLHLHKRTVTAVVSVEGGVGRAGGAISPNKFHLGSLQCVEIEFTSPESWFHPG